jgi:hypothetical protein
MLEWRLDSILEWMRCQNLWYLSIYEESKTTREIWKGVNDLNWKFIWENKPNEIERNICCLNNNEKGMEMNNIRHFCQKIVFWNGCDVKTFDIWAFTKKAKQPLFTYRIPWVHIIINYCVDKLYLFTFDKSVLCYSRHSSMDHYFFQSCSKWYFR